MEPLLLAVLSAALLIVFAAILLLRGRGAQEKALSIAKAPSVPQRPSLALEDPAKPTIRVLYGTQTGTAERFSKQLGNDLRAKFGDSTHVDVRDVETYKAADRLAKEKLVVLCMATYGDGEPTDNAAEFYNWLLKEADTYEASAEPGEPPMKGVTYAVFGLGNKQYEHFNSVGKKVYKALQTLGAQPLCRRGDGDDDGVIDDDFEKWCTEFHAALDARSDLVGAKADQNGVKAPVPVSAYKVVMAAPGASVVSPFPRGTGKDVHSPFWGRVRIVRELHTPASDRSCVHCEVDVSGSAITYESGDHIAIYAQNSPAVVSEVAKLLEYDLNALFTLELPDQEQPNLPPPLPGPISVRTALAYFADVLSSPHKEALAALATFASDRDEAERLRLLGSTEGKAEYAEFIGKPHRSLLEVLRAFPSAKPSIGAFFGCIAARLQPRFYSISSSPKLAPKNVHVTCAVVRDVMPTGRVHEGVCSTWLQRDGQGAEVPVFVRHSHFRLPADPKSPIIMVGPGTGLAPFRGFLQEREALRQSGVQLGPAHLFFGCRSRHTDYIYQQELEGYVASGALSNLHLAFSRDGASKDYVQHHMERQGAEIWALLQQGAYVYVCGDAKHMARDVHRTLVSVVQAHKGCSGTQAEAVVKEITDSGRYQRDVW